MLSTFLVRYTLLSPRCGARFIAAPFCSAAARSSPLPPPPEQILLRAPHPSTIKPDDLMRDCEVKRTKGSGPGGQHRNKVETAIAITHTPTSLSAQATESRSQATNAKQALFRLRLRLALKCRTASDDDGATPPSALWSSRTKSGKVAVNENHADFPALLSEALDACWERQGDVKAAAEGFGVSSSQLVKLLAKTPEALQFVNQVRASEGLGALRANK